MADKVSFTDFGTKRKVRKVKRKRTSTSPAKSEVKATSLPESPVSELIAFHPPVTIGCLCIFMYIRSRFLQDKLQKVRPAKNKIE